MREAKKKNILQSNIRFTRAYTHAARYEPIDSNGKMIMKTQHKKKKNTSKKRKQKLKKKNNWFM